MPAVYSLFAWLIPPRVPMAFGCRLRNASRRVRRARDVDVDARTHVQVAAFDRTKSAVNTVLRAELVRPAERRLRVYGIFSRGSTHWPKSGSEFGSAWFWLAMLLIGWPIR